MDNQSQRDVANSADTGAAASRVWRALTALLILLLVVCGIWIGVSGINGALNSSAFQWAMIATGLVLIWRVGGPFVLQLVRGKEAVDKRNYVDMSWRSQWFKRRS